MDENILTRFYYSAFLQKGIGFCRFVSYNKRLVRMFPKKVVIVFKSQCRRMFGKTWLVWSEWMYKIKMIEPFASTSLLHPNQNVVQRLSPLQGPSVYIHSEQVMVKLVLFVPSLMLVQMTSVYDTPIAEEDYIWNTPIQIVWNIFEVHSTNY